ncbi:MAG: hypothetical protein Q9182_005930 [Xanthomendoza sp. 2 TL-2023]
MSPVPSTYCGIAAGENASFPSATYLRTRYKRLQKKIVSRMPSSRLVTSGRPSSENETDHSKVPETQIVSPPGRLDPSFQAIRVLNGQPGTGSVPHVIPAIIMDCNGNLHRITDSVESTPATMIDDNKQSPVSSGNDKHSFGARLNRFTHAVDRRQRIRFAQSGNGQDVIVFASSTSGSETGSPRSVTDQVAAQPENWGRIIRASMIVQLQSQESSSDAGRSSSCLGNFDARHDSGKLLSSEESDSIATDTGVTRARVRSRIIAESERQALEKRILDKIAKKSSESLESSIAAADRKDKHLGRSKTSSTTDSSHTHHMQTVDPRRVHTIDTNGEVRCRTISPIPLDFRRVRGLQTPSVGTSGSSSKLSSPPIQFSKRAPKSLRHIRQPDILPASPVATTDAWLSQDSDQEFSHDGQAESEKHQLQSPTLIEKVLSWLHRDKHTITESTVSSGMKIGQAVSISRDEPGKAPGTCTRNRSSRPDKPLADVTNVRQSVILGRTSFTQEKARRESIQANLEERKKLRLARIQAVHESHLETGPGHVTATSSEETSASSTVKRVGKKDKLHPEITYTLARLEGGVLPRPTSPFPIRRFRSDSASYGSDVEVELAPLRLRNPRPLRPDHEDVVGSWTAPLEEAVEAGFECVLEAPEEDE